MIRSLCYINSLHQLKTLEDKFIKMQARPFQASAAIVAYMKRGDNPKIPEIEEISSVACAIQNLCLTATAYGISLFVYAQNHLY